jgi:hypothetical protein
MIEVELTTNEINVEVQQAGPAGKEIELQKVNEEIARLSVEESKPTEEPKTEEAKEEDK